MNPLIIRPNSRHRPTVNYKTEVLDSTPPTTWYQRNKGLLYLLLSLIVFPIGIYRLHRGLKQVAANYALMSSSPAKRLEFRQECLPNTHPHATSITTKDGLRLSAVKIPSPAQANKPPGEQEWIVFAPGNLMVWQKIDSSLKNMGERSQKNILCINYRNTCDSDTSKSLISFKDLLTDYDSGVEHILATGVPIRNIEMRGISLGGAVAIGVASLAKYQQEGNAMRCCVQKTCTSLSDVAYFKAQEIVKETVDPLWKELEESSPRIFSGLIAFLTAPLQLAFRVLFYVLSFLENLLTGQLRSAASDLYELGKSLIVFPTITITGLLALTLRDTTSKKMAKFNRILKDWLNESILVRLTESTKFRLLIKGLMSSVSWEFNNVKRASKIHHLEILHAPNDELMLYGKSSLAAPFLPKTWKKNDQRPYVVPGRQNYIQLTALDLTVGHAGCN